MSDLTNRSIFFLHKFQKPTFKSNRVLDSIQSIHKRKFGRLAAENTSLISLNVCSMNIEIACKLFISTSHSQPVVSSYLGLGHPFKLHSPYLMCSLFSSNWIFVGRVLLLFFLVHGKGKKFSLLFLFGV